MASKMADMETLVCPICKNEISQKLLERWELDEDDIKRIEDLLNRKLLMQILELGELASKYLKPEALGTEIQVRESLGKLSDKATDLMDKTRELAGQLVKASEEKKVEITNDALQKQQDLIAAFQNDIKKLQGEFNAFEQKRLAEIEKANAAIQEIQKAIVGTGIGDIRQVTVIKDLKSACPDDQFSDEKATKRGADIVAKVMVKGREAGTIVVSVKEQEEWKNDFIEQIKKNLKEEQTQWGILVTKVFPSDALNEKAYLDNNGILLVRTEYAAAAYIGLRHAVIHWNEAQSWLKTQQERAGMQEHIVKVLREWIQGEKFKEILGKIDEAAKAAQETDKLLQDWQNYNDNKIKNARKLQDKIVGYLRDCDVILGDLPKKLHDKN